MIRIFQNNYLKKFVATSLPLDSAPLKAKPKIKSKRKYTREGPAKSIKLAKKAWLRIFQTYKR